MPNVNDLEVWVKLPESFKIWWLKQQVQIEQQKCDRCWQYVCACDLEPDYV